MAIPLNLYDQMVYDAGYKFIPQSQYLLNPFQIPTEPTSNVGGLPSQVAPIIPRVISQPQGDGDGGNRMGPASPRNIRNTGDGLFAKSKASANNTGGITNALIDMEGAYYGTPKSMIYNRSTGRFQPDYDYRDSPTLVNETLRGAPDVFDISKKGDPALNLDSTMVQGVDPYGEKTNFLESIINKGKTGIETIAQFLPFGEKSITGAALRGIGSLLPERDYRQNVLEDFYDDEDTQDLMSQIPGMSDYNVISGDRKSVV